VVVAMAGAPLLLVMLVGAVGLAAAERGGGKLRQGYYEQSCPRAEQIVKDYVERHIPQEPSVAATLIRTHFHDCFVRVRTHALSSGAPSTARVCDES
jgi:peroxidase